MAKFLTGNELNAEVEKLFEKAENQIILISPYIRLHERFASTLKSKRTNPNLEIIIVFGKNEEDISKSMKQDDFDFFKEFPNIEIRYEKRLHAKYYANETSAILTSMNLYSYSQDNNIEFGILTKGTVLGNFASKLWEGEEGIDSQAWNSFERVIEQSDLLFKKVPEFESGFWGISKNYKSSKIETDELSIFFANKNEFDSKNRKNYDKKAVQSPISKTASSGFCIRTKKQIPFDPARPMCDEAMQSWAKFSNEDYPEKFCHFSGEPSNGQTTKAKPILRSNWRKAKEVHGR